MRLAGQRPRQRLTDGETGVVGKPDVTHRAAAAFGAGQAKQPQDGRRHHRGFSRADGEAAHDQRRQPVDVGREGPERHQQCARDHHARGAESIGDPSAEGTSRGAGQRRRADREPDEHRPAAEGVDIAGQDAEHGPERRVAQDRGGEDHEVSGAGGADRQTTAWQHALDRRGHVSMLARGRFGLNRNVK